MFQFWIGFGIILIFAEFLMPGLVAIFLGLGAFTVVALLHFHYIDSVAAQFLTWFVSSTVYIFTLRLWVIRLYPSSRKKQDVDQDREMIGQEVIVVQTISAGGEGRIRHGESTWPALSQNGELIEEGERVRIRKRKNISWIVEKVSS